MFAHQPFGICEFRCFGNFDIFENEQTSLSSFYFKKLIHPNVVFLVVSLFTKLETLKSYNVEKFKMFEIKQGRFIILTLFK